jgi:hypothetical protein
LDRRKRGAAFVVRGIGIVIRRGVGRTRYKGVSISDEAGRLR